MAVSIVGEAGVRLRPDTTGFSTQAEVGILGPLGEVAKKGAALFGVAWGAEKTFEYLKDSVKSYSDTTEATTRAQTVFGSSFEDVQKMAEGAARSMGQSEAQAIGSASTFGNLFRSMGVTTEESASMSTGFVKLASDMASFNNVPIDQALGALQSGVTGMTRPLKQFGVNIDAAAVSTRAAQIVTESHGQTTLQAAKAQAAYEQIMKQTTLTQGDFTRTSMNLADQTRIIAAESTNLKDKVGAAIYPFVDLGARGISGVLLPALTKLAEPLAKIGDGAKVLNTDLSELTGSAKAEFQGFNVAGDTWATRLGISFGNAGKSARDYWGTFTDAAKGGGEGLLAQAPTIDGFLARFGTGLHGVALNADAAWMSIRTSAKSELGPLESELAPTWDGIKASIGQLFSGGGLSGSGSGFLSMLNNVIGAAAPVITNLLSSLGGEVQSFLPVLSSAFTQVVPIVQSVIGQIVPVVKTVLPVIMQISGITRTVFLTALQALLPVIPPIVATLGQLISTLVGGLGPILRQVAPLISTLINNAMREFKAVLEAIVPVIPPLVSAIAQVAQLLAGALLGVLKALMPVLPPLVGAIGQIAQAIGGALVQAVGALAPVLPTIINALMSLIEAALHPLLLLLPAIVSLVPPLVQVIVAVVNAVLPFLPLIVQVVAALVQLAVVAIQPLMPIIQILASLLVVLVNALVPIISVALSALAAIVSFSGGLISNVIGAVSAVLGWFQRLFVGISSIGASISRFLGGIFDGLAGAASAAFNAVAGAIRWAVNGYISIINGAIGFINNNLIGTINKIPGVNIPGIPLIPKLHEGGVFQSGLPGGEGLAILRDGEQVVTPEDRATAARLVAAMSPTTATTAAAAGTTGGGGNTEVNNYITQLPGESGEQLANKVSDKITFDLNNGVTRTVGAGVPS